MLLMRSYGALPKLQGTCSLLATALQSDSAERNADWVLHACSIPRVSSKLGDLAESRGTATNQGKGISIQLHNNAFN